MQRGPRGFLAPPDVVFCGRLFSLRTRAVQSIDQLSNEELLSAIAGRSAANAMLQRYGRLNHLAQASFTELQEIRGVGRSRAAAIKSAFLLAQRLAHEALPERPLLDSPSKVADLLREEHRLSTVEHFHVLCLTTRRRLIADHRIAQGILDTVLVHPREVFFHAINSNASAVLLAHNHPGGDPSPSESDIRVTRDLMRAGQLLRIEVLDHIVIGRSSTERPQDYISMREQGLMYL